MRQITARIDGASVDAAVDDDTLIDGDGAQIRRRHAGGKQLVRAARQEKSAP